MEKNNIIDWQLSIKLANNRPELAKELLNLFMAELPEAQQNINAAFAEEDWSKLQQHVHRLHGATCYCGIPQLKDLAASLENNLKTPDKNIIMALITNLNEIIAQLIAIYPTFNPDKS